MIYGIACYLIWGAFAAYFPLLKPASPFEILGQRIVWTAVFMLVIAALSRRLVELKRLALKVWVTLFIAAILIAANWVIYIVAVNTDHVTEAALGYFINPLVSVLLGAIFLGERLPRNQKIAVGIAACGVIVLTFASGQPPLIGLGLALSFGFYSLIKKRVPLSAVASLTAETLLLTPWAIIYLCFDNTFAGLTSSHTWLLISSGVVTALPLLLFGLAAKRLPLATIGMLQYMTPTMQMLWALFAVHETLTPIRWVGFIIIWTAVAVYLADIIRITRKTRQHTETITA